MSSVCNFCDEPAVHYGACLMCICLYQTTIGGDPDVGYCEAHALTKGRDLTDHKCNRLGPFRGHGAHTFD